MDELETILEEAGRLTSGDRNSAYGHPYYDYSCVAALWTAMLKHAGYLKLEAGNQLPPDLCALMMCALKLVRLSQNLVHRDSLVDLAGYARLVEMIQEKRTELWVEAKKESFNDSRIPDSKGQS